jgi:hypothetical protein
LPFLGEFLGNAFEDSFRLSCKDAIIRGYEGGKVPALGLAGFEVLPLLVIFLLPQLKKENLHWLDNPLPSSPFLPSSLTGSINLASPTLTRNLFHENPLE